VAAHELPFFLPTWRPERQSGLAISHLFNAMGQTQKWTVRLIDPDHH